MTNDLTKAKNDFKRAIKISPKEPSGYYFLAMVYVKEENTFNACSNLSKASDYGFNVAVEIERYCK